MEDERYIAQLAKMVQENFFAHLLFIPERLPSCTVVKARELIMLNKHTARAGSFMVLRSRLPESQLEQAIATVRSYAEREKAPIWWLVAPDDTPAHLLSTLERTGLQQIDTYYGMTLELSEMALEQIEVRVERIVSNQQLQDLMALLSTVPAQATASYQQLAGMPVAEDDYERWYIAYQDERPVAVGTLTVFADSAGVYDVLVAPGLEAERIKQALVTELLAYAYALGVEDAVVVCQAADIELYRDLGFEDLLTFELMG